MIDHSSTNNVLRKSSIFLLLFFVDEKFNFERLEETTALNKQPLISPQPLGFSPVEELVVRNHLEIFRFNGFEFTDGSDGSLMLQAVPFSKGIMFGKDDVMELIAMIESGVTVHRGSSLGNGLGDFKTTLRPSKVRAMLASRACRSSIMIGKPLDVRSMEGILKNLSTLKSPWNCPHGRPTMRHLTVLPTSANL